MLLTSFSNRKAQEISLTLCNVSKRYSNQSNHQFTMKFIFSFLLLSTSLLPVKAQKLTVMSYNIHHGTNAAEKDYLTEIAELIKSSKADLVGLQEVDSICKRSGNVDQMKRLAELTGMYYAFARHFAYDGGAYGNGILSRYPISDIKNHRITLIKKDGGKDSRSLIAAEVTLPNNKRMLFASVHFALDSPSRLIQAKETLALLGATTMPVILTGDLNCLPGTPELAVLDTFFTEVDPLLKPTFPAEKPTRKIDYIYVSSSSLKRVVSYKVFDEIGYSDHAPMLVKVRIRLM